MQAGENGSWPAWIAPLDHTADTGIVVRAKTLKELFARAAWGLFAMICDITAVRGKRALVVSVEAPDREALLVRWLSELNFIHQTQHLLFCRFDVRTLRSARLTALVHGEKFSPCRHRLTTEVKAVTYHNLRIERLDGQWRATVLFDV